jgi:hypothetical protein
MKNKLSDLNDNLFAQLERLSDEKLKGEQLKNEIERTKAIKSISQEIIAGGQLALEAKKELGVSIRDGDLPAMLEVKRKEKQVKFITDGYRCWSLSELTQRLNATFSTEFTQSQVRSFTRNHSIKSGRTGQFEKGAESWNAGTKGLMKPNSGSFKAGMVPHNHRPVGAERVNVEGYIEIKTAEPNIWNLKQRVIYERENGPIPAGHNVRFLDGNRLNCAPDNLILVSDSENAILTTTYKFNHQPLEHRDTLVLMAKLDAKTACLSKDMER